MASSIAKEILKKRFEILEQARMHGAKNLRIFGSGVRDELTETSDIDFLVDMDEGRDLFDLGALRCDLEDILHRKVDVVTASALHSKMRPYIMNEARRL